MSRLTLVRGVCNGHERPWEGFEGTAAWVQWERQFVHAFAKENMLSVI